MKGLSMTLTIVIVAIVLLVTALVIMTIFGAQMAQIVGILNPWSSSQLELSLCQQACASKCQLTDETTIPWPQISVKTDAHPNGETCDKIMVKATGAASISEIDPCKCMGL